MARPKPPPAMRRAAYFMLAGAAAAVVNGIVTGLTTHDMVFYISQSSSSNSADVQASYLVGGIISGVISAGLWLWMAHKTDAGRNWARVLSSVLFGFMCLQFIGGIVSLANSAGSAPSFIVTFAEWGLGLGAIIALWQPESSEFFTFTTQLRMTHAYGAPYPGYQPPGYAQPPYGQPPHYGQPRDDER